MAASSPPVALADLDDHVLLVVGIALDERKLQLVLELLESALELRDHPPKLRVLARGLQVLARRTPFLRELVRAFELLQPTAGVRGLMVVGEDRRVAHPLLRVGVGALQFLDQAVHLAHGDQHRLRPQWNRCREAVFAEASGSRSRRRFSTPTTATARAAASTRGPSERPRGACRARASASSRARSSSASTGPQTTPGSRRSAPGAARASSAGRGRRAGDLHPPRRARRRPGHPARVPHLRGLQGAVGRASGRRPAPLPGRASRVAADESGATLAKEASEQARDSTRGTARACERRILQRVN